MNRFKKKALRVSIFDWFIFSFFLKVPSSIVIMYNSLISTINFTLFYQILQVIAEHLSVEEVEVIRDMFKLMDTDNDGKVTYEELKAGLRKVGSQLAEPEIKMLMEVVNSCGYLNSALRLEDS